MIQKKSNSVPEKWIKIQGIIREMLRLFLERPETDKNKTECQENDIKKSNRVRRKWWKNSRKCMENNKKSNWVLGKCRDRNSSGVPENDWNLIKGRIGPKNDRWWKNLTDRFLENQTVIVECPEENADQECLENDKKI